jgi:hypothetical protein
MKCGCGCRFRQPVAAAKGISPLFEIALVRLRLDHVPGFIVNAANRVTIGNGAFFFFLVRGHAALTTGTIFTIIENTAATPIAGAFSNLPDGSLITANGNTFQASYEGGTGNDLTLTVVP